MKKKKILFLGESYRADAITWMNGLREFGDFEIITWELKTSNNNLKNRILRIFEFELAFFRIRKIIKLHKPDMVIAERTTSYGFLAALCGVKPVAIAQQGRTDLWPEKSILLPLKKLIQHYAFQKADLIHAWGPVMTISMIKANVDMNKVLVLPKGINLEKFGNKNNANPEKISAIVTRSLLPEYRHAIILKSFAILNQKGIDFVLTIIGEGTQLSTLKDLSKKLNIENKVNFTGRIPNTALPKLLQKSNIYISMPITEGVSASLFEAMATNCYPIVTDIPGNQSWIKHRENGQLVTVDDFEMLAEELIWAFENSEYRNNVVLKNRKFVEQNADYNINMKIIANKYHELINTNSPN
ncbi:glycosyltransferase [Flavobacterium gawalongense]|uniref:Glycosyltransferase n=1 Tax=Flavobacterium gawalongense TaxID=2594432 RepID=A0A553BZ15_9FLAO|nr:glycosyltransferase [Flavobacterium gawalongense]TRX04631.1 glycosyltransferase [Flavobacterium gawalongense]TRX10518.1 glycosyltransferase [Flavobacterium gawalongense]TRX13561.1 glycosyltransferase [Flavobacterium gawalongense]TRX15507.1 glycosyltransferase [Flavobacterium gawalongense]TRX31346.1 glycosyltransferase [Flavobacterium gawalongense]